jgi:flagellar biosynthesis protein FlhA
MSVLVKVLQQLLQERVPIRNLRSICEALADVAPKSQDPAVLVAAARVSLGRSIVQSVGGLREELPVITLDPGLEQSLQDSLGGTGESGTSVEPGLADRLQRSLADSARRQEVAGEPAVVLVAPRIRPWIARLMRYATPNLAVLAYNEIPDNRRIRVIAAVGR